MTRNEYYKRRRRDERAPQAWDNHLDAARTLLEIAELPFQTHEFALRLLLAHKESLPTPKKTHLARWLQSDSPLLLTTATRHVAAQMEAGKDLNAAIVARAYLFSGVRQQRRIEARLAGYASTEKWSHDFAAALFEPIAANTSQQLPRRQIAAALLLAREFDTQIENGLLRTLPLLFASGRSELAQWAAKAIERAPVAHFPNLLVSLEALPHAFRRTATEALMHGAREQKFGFNIARQITQSGTDWTRQTAWQVLSASKTEASVLRQLWEEFLSSELDTPALRTAMTSPHALHLLERAGISASQLAEQLRTRAWLLDLLTSEVFARIADRMPAAIVLQLMQSASDELWGELRPLWLQSLRGPKIVEFWRAAWAASDAGNTAIAQRVLNDAEVVSTFNQLAVDDFSSLLQTENTIIAELLRNWLQNHEQEIEDGDPLLLAAATHGLAPVRSWGLAQSQRRGVTMPFALRLLETELPQTVAAGQAFFESATDEQIIEYSLALCDSPQKSVRDYGRRFIGQREASLPQDTLLSRLFENPNSDIQEFVAALLQNNGASATLEFNQAVLRTRNRARRAKELVKRNAQRQPETQPIDTKTLLEMARSRTPRDAEWALCQLAQLAIAGQEIEGLSTEGTIGI